MRERVCSNCGGKSYEVVGQNMVKCLFCGSLYVDERASKDEEFLLARANDLLREFNFDKAFEEFSKTISLFPRSFEAYFGRALAKQKIALFPDESGELSLPCFFGEKIVSLKDDDDFEKAVSFAPQERAAFFNEISNRTERVKENYAKSAADKNFDCILCINGAGEEKKTLENDILKISENANLSFFVCDTPFSCEKEHLAFRVLESARVFVFVILDQDEISAYRKFFERYFYAISLHKKTKSSFILCLNTQKVSKQALPKEFLQSSILELDSVSFLEDLQLRVVSEYKNSEKKLAKIDTIDIQQESPKKKEYVDIENVVPVELGNYDVENLTVSAEAKKKWIFLALKNGDFETADKLIQQELETHQYSSELLFAQLLAEKKICTPEDFFSKISNFSDKQQIENILKYADKGFAENFVDNWEKLIQDLGEVEYFNQYLIFLASFKTPNRENFIAQAEKKAVETLDETLIENVEKCFDASEVDRFVNFYFLLAQKSDDKKYYQKILDIDAGHEQSNIMLMLQKFKTSRDKLTYRDRGEVENMLKFLNEQSRVALISAIVEMIFPVAFQDLEEAQNQIEFYLSYVQTKNALIDLLLHISCQFQQMKFFKVAEKYLSLAISKTEQLENDEENFGKNEDFNCKKADLFWKLIQIKCHCRTEQELVMSKTKPSDLPEWQTLLELGDDKQDEIYGQIVSRNNLFVGQRQEFEPDLLDKKELKEHLQSFLMRNQNILLEIEKQENFSAKKGTDYFRLQLQPFEKYLAQIDQIEDFEAYQQFFEKIKTRLSAMNLSFDSSISALEIQERAEELSTVQFATAEPSEKFKKVQKSVKNRQILQKYLTIFLEFLPLAFIAVFSVFALCLPKQIYEFFPQTGIVVFVVFSALVVGGNLAYLIFKFLKKEKMQNKEKLTLFSLVGLGVINIVLFVVAFYFSPTYISISDSEQLQTLLRNAPHCNFSLEKDLNFEKEWKNTNFYGIFDGNGHVISGIDDSFLRENHGKIKNLKISINSKLEDVKIFGTFAQTNFGEMEDCSVSGEIELKNCQVFGGLVGENQGKLLSCQSGLTIHIQTVQEAFVGGLVGKSGGKNKQNEISKSGFLGEIELKGQSRLTVGGLVGLCDDTDIFENFSNATISVESTSATVGGLAGSVNHSTPHDNFAQGSISTQSPDDVVGGLFGIFTNPSSQGAAYSYSSVTFDTVSENGALVGSLLGIFDHCFATGDGKLCAKNLPPVSKLKDCGFAEKYNSDFEFDPKIWDLSTDLPKLKWQTT